MLVFILPTQMFVPDLPWQPIPVHTVPESEDTVRLCMVTVYVHITIPKCKHVVDLLLSKHIFDLLLSNLLPHPHPFYCVYNKS